MNKFASILLGGCALLVTVAAAHAQDYPSKPIEIIVPYGAGGGTDLSVRLMTEVMQKYMPEATFVVRNQPGGGGGIGTGEVLSAEPDGYTLGTGSQGPIALLPHYGATTYTIDDVEFLGLMGRNLQIVLACADAPFSTFDEFVTYAKENPAMTLVGNSGAGGANHLSMEAFSTAAGVTFEHVPFGGAAEALTACAGGHIDAVTATPSEARPHVDSGAVTPLFIMEEERIDEYPDTPTAIEEGIDFTWSSWKGIIAPKGLPEEVKAKLEAALESTFTDPEFVSRMTEMGDFVDYRDAEGYEALARKDSEMAEGVIRNLGMYGMNAP